VFLARLPEGEQRKIFEMWKEVEPPDQNDDLPNDHPLSDWNPYEERNIEWQRQEFVEALQGWVSIIYYHVKQQNLYDPVQFIERAIEESERALENDVTVELELEEGFHTGRLLRKFQEREPLRPVEIQHLRNEADISVHDLTDYYDSFDRE
jgi:hypothetical protein